MIWLKSVEHILCVIFLPMNLFILHVSHHGSFLHKFLKIFFANFYRFYLSIIKTIRIRFLFYIQTEARLILRFFKLIGLLIHFEIAFEVIKECLVTFEDLLARARFLAHAIRLYVYCVVLFVRRLEGYVMLFGLIVGNIIRLILRRLFTLRNGRQWRRWYGIAVL